MSKIFTITNGLENLGAFRTGGQGSVYKGKRIGEIITAVKLLPTPIHTESMDNKNFSDFTNEVEKLKKVNEIPNPNIVKIYSSGLTDSGSFPFIEMEYIEGPDLEELLKPPHDQVFSIKEAIKVTEHLANALAHCHAVNVKHGDIKSNNVKFNSYSGNYVLLDFGLAVMSDEQRRTSLRQAGAIEFMAPEQYEGILLFESDVYSFGVVLYEILSGQVPFPLPDNGETARNNVRLSHIETPVPDVLEIRRQNLPANWTNEQREREMQVPQWLLLLLNKCLEKKSEQRFANGIALKDFIVQNSISQAQLNNQSTGNQSAMIAKYQKILASKDMTIATLKEKTERNTRMGKSIIRIPAPVFFLSLILLGGLLLFTGYGMLKGSLEVDQVQNHADSSLPEDQTPFKRAHFKHPALTGYLPENVVLNIDSIKKSEMAALTKKRYTATSDTDDDDKGKDKKKKRKKILDFLF